MVGPTEVELAWWRGRLAGRARPTATVTLRAPIKRAASSGAGAFLGLADDGEKYWLKVPGNQQGDVVLVNEVIVAELGRTLGAPVRPRVPVRIPAELARGWRLYPAPVRTESVIAHGSLHLEHAMDEDRLKHAARDDNPRRQARLLGLWDLCVGDDAQWLYDASHDLSVWSYDHGFWFTTGEGDWDESVLARLIDLDGTWSDQTPRAIDGEALREFANDVERLDPNTLLAIMARVPVEWGAADHDLEAMAWFLHRRRLGTAARLRAMANG